jgi:uncharacterized membrane protein
MFDISHLHPMVVHFPVAIIIVGFLADLASLIFKKERCLSTMGLYLEMLGILAAIVAFGTGYFLTGDTLEGAGHLGEMHKLFATLTLITIIFAGFFRILIIYLNKGETYLKYVAMGIFFLAFVFVGITGYFGGMVVYGNI